MEEIARIDEERERGVSYDLRMLCVPLFEQSREVVECEQRNEVLFNKHASLLLTSHSLSSLLIDYSQMDGAPSASEDFTSLPIPSLLNHKVTALSLPSVLHPP